MALTGLPAALARQELVEYRRDKASALKLIGVGDAKRNPKLDPAELAAWTTVAGTILNMDETGFQTTGVKVDPGVVFSGEHWFVL